MNHWDSIFFMLHSFYIVKILFFWDFDLVGIFDTNICHLIIIESIQPLLWWKKFGDPSIDFSFITIDLTSNDTIIAVIYIVSHINQKSLDKNGLGIHWFRFLKMRFFVRTTGNIYNLGGIDAWTIETRYFLCFIHFISSKFYFFEILT